MSNTVFSLRRLEMAMPYLNKAEMNDPKAFVMLAALYLADEQTLKLVAAGNNEALQVFIDKAYDMAGDEAAGLLSFFIKGSERFALCLSGLTPEEVNQLMSQKMTMLRKTQGLE